MVAPITKPECAPCSNSSSPAICRTDKKSHIHHLSTIASSEREARRQFASRFVLVLSARIRLAGWPHESGAVKHPGPA
ncbi:host cell division inhibitor Icd-like protein [Klebsiella aerogenes]|uniref:host cell division inhibitor Icd-like protein n=1 Tax=Klebsiella aerogenes TaxID=548 RepID=UPI0013DFA3C8|nr:host cell division inhibitor Icd-like protein [Klebsiella aerogenes]